MNTIAEKEELVEPAACRSHRSLKFFCRSWARNGFEGDPLPGRLKIRQATTAGRVYMDFQQFEAPFVGSLPAEYDDDEGCLKVSTTAGSFEVRGFADSRRRLRCRPEGNTRPEGWDAEEERGDDDVVPPGPDR